MDLLATVCVIIVLVTAHCVRSDALEPRIALPPRSFNASLGAAVVFNCDAVTDFGVLWKVNGSRILPAGTTVASPDPDPVIGIVHATLTIPATIEFNETTIQCEVSATESSEVATLLIQGELAAPSDVDGSKDTDDTHMIEWIAPFTLDLTDIHPDINYTICRNGILCINNISDTVYVCDNTCDPVMYSVSACNPVGCSENASVMFPPDPVDFTVDGYTFMYEDSDPVVHIDVTVDGDSCSRIYNGVFRYRLCDGVAREARFVTLEIDGSTHRIRLTDGLVKNAVYTGEIGSQGMMKSVSFSTFDVCELVMVYEGEGRVHISCSLASGSSASGCLVTLSDANGQTYHFAIMRELESSGDIEEVGDKVTVSGFVSVPDGVYEVTALDIEEDRSIASCEAITATTYTFPPPTTPSVTTSTTGTTSPTDSTGPRSSNSSNFDESTIGGIVAAVILAMAGIAVVAVAALVFLRWHKTKGVAKFAIELEENPTYGCPPPPISMEKNSAYSSVTTRKQRRNA